MKKQLIILVIFLLLITALVAAASQNIGEALTSGNILFINSGGRHRTSALVGWYPVEEWEVETCTRDLTSSINISDQSDSGAFSKNNLIIDTTLTMQAFQQNYAEDVNYKEYEISWYVHPFNDAINYEIQYYAEDWTSFTPSIKNEAGPSYGDMGYYSWSGDYNITAVRILAGSESLTIPVENI
jgi:hypothetical protein